VFTDVQLRLLKTRIMSRCR